MVGAHGSCSQTNPGYLESWNCIKGRIASGSAGLTNNSQTIRYVAAGDAIAEQVRAGTVSDAQGKALLAAELERGETSFNRARAAGSPTICNVVATTVICN
jgi:hypothetical protein